MSLDRSLKGKGALQRHRNVLKRSERIATLEDGEKWQDGQSVFGLVKVGHRKTVTAKKSKKEDAATAEAGAAAPAAGAAAAAPAAKGAAKK